MKTLAFASAMLVASSALAASGDVNYIKTSGPVVMSPTQISQLVTFVGQIAPGLTAANAINLSCGVQGAVVTCQAYANATASPASFIADYVAGLVTRFVSVVP